MGRGALQKNRASLRDRAELLQAVANEIARLAVARRVHLMERGARRRRRSENDAG